MDRFEVVRNELRLLSRERESLARAVNRKQLVALKRKSEEEREMESKD